MELFFIIATVLSMKVISIAGVCPTGNQGNNYRCQGNNVQCPANSYCYPYGQYNGMYYTPVCCPQTVAKPQIQTNTRSGSMVNVNDDAFRQRSLVSVIQDQIRSYPLMIYSKSSCVYCKRAKDLLSYSYPQYRFSYLDFDSQSNGVWLSEGAQAVSGMKTVPQIWICQQLVGGADDLQRLHQSGQLLQKLQSCFSRYNIRS